MRKRQYLNPPRKEQWLAASQQPKTSYYTDGEYGYWRLAVPNKPGRFCWVASQYNDSSKLGFGGNAQVHYGHLYDPSCGSSCASYVPNPVAIKVGTMAITEEQCASFKLRYDALGGIQENYGYNFFPDGRAYTMVSALPYREGYDLFDILDPQCDKISPNLKAVFSDPNNKRRIAKLLVNAVLEFQVRGMIHRDIKPENIMVDYDPTKGNPEAQFSVSIVDWDGYLTGKEGEIVTVPESEFCGSFQYVSPGIVKRHLEDKYSYSHATDNYALGVVLFMLFFAADEKCLYYSKFNTIYNKFTQNFETAANKIHCYFVHLYQPFMNLLAEVAGDLDSADPDYDLKSNIIRLMYPRETRVTLETVASSLDVNGGESKAECGNLILLQPESKQHGTLSEVPIPEVKLEEKPVSQVVSAPAPVPEEKPVSSEPVLSKIPVTKILVGIGVLLLCTGVLSWLGVIHLAAVGLGALAVKAVEGTAVLGGLFSFGGAARASMPPQTGCLTLPKRGR